VPARQIMPVPALAALLVAAALLLPWPVQAQAPAEQKELVAVMELDAVGATKVQAATLSDRLREELLATGRFRIVDRAQMDKLLAEQALQQTGCTSQECAVQVGKVLGVRKMISGKASKIEDDLWLISCLLVDVETAETEKAVSFQHEGTFRSVLADGAAKLVAKLTEGMGVPKKFDAKIELTGVPEDAEVFLNGAPKGRGPLSVEKLPPGDYELVVKRKGFRPWKRSSRLVGGANWKLKYFPEKYRVAIFPPRRSPGNPEEWAGVARAWKSQFQRYNVSVTHAWHREFGDESLKEVGGEIWAGPAMLRQDVLIEKAKVLGDDFVFTARRVPGADGVQSWVAVFIDMAAGKTEESRGIFPPNSPDNLMTILEDFIGQFFAARLN